MRGVTFLIDPSTFVEGCTYLLVGSGSVEPFDSVPVPSAALLLNLGRGGSTPEERDRSLQVGDLLLGTMGQSQFVCDVPSISAYLPHLASPSVSSPLVLTDYFTFPYTSLSVWSVHIYVIIVLINHSPYYSGLMISHVCRSEDARPVEMFQQVLPVLPHRQWIVPRGSRSLKS